MTEPHDSLFLSDSFRGIEAAMKGADAEHFVQFFEQDATLLHCLGDYLSCGLIAGELCIVFASQAHRDGLCLELGNRGENVEEAISSGQLVLFDAAETLAGLLEDGRIDSNRMRDRIAAIMDKARGSGQRVRIFGELVAMLWSAGQRQAAVALEQDWNELQSDYAFSLYCAHPFDELGGVDAIEPLRNLCGSHAHIIPPESFSIAADPGDRLRAVVEWKHKARLLELEVSERRSAEESARQVKEELEQQIEDLRHLHRLSVGLTGTLDVTTVLREVLDGALAVHGTDMGLLSLCDEDGKRLSLKVHSGFEPDFLHELERTQAGQGICGHCLERKRRVVVQDVEKDPMFESFRETARCGGFRACHSSPLVTRSQRIIGVLSVHFRQPERPSDRQMQMMDLFAQTAADAIENARLHTQARTELDERHQLLLREQEARSESEKAGRLKDEFLATVSHELRTPLTAIIGWTHMLRYDRLDEATVEKALETIERAATSQAQLVEDILDVSRMISGKLRLSVEPVDAAFIVQAACNSVELAATSKGIELSVTNGPAATPGLQLLGDSSRLQQVVWNLISNAIKFTPHGGRVEVRVQRNADHLEILVRDNGEGIDPEFVPMLFARFLQADGSSTRKHGGLGLGLAIVRHIVELHGGTVAAESEGKGRGATFTVKLPMSFRNEIRASAPGVSGPSLAAPGTQPAALEGVRVLLVDDDPDILAMLSAVLEDQQAIVRTASSSAQALDVLTQRKVDVLVSDLSMPNEDGFELIRRLRLGEQGRRHLPAIALTAYVRVEDRRRALEAGFNMFVPKPVEPTELIATISNLAAPRAVD